MNKLLAPIGIIFLCQSLYSASPYIAFRSQSRDKVRQWVGSVNHIHLSDREAWWGSAWIMAEYTRSFRPNTIIRCLFDDDVINSPITSNGLTLNETCDNSCNSRTIKVQGSQVANRDPKAWLADYFYLAPDFSSSLRFSPHISNFLIDLDLYVGLDELLCGTYLFVYGPITHTKWDLDFCETRSVKGTGSYSFGYFNPTGIPNANLLQSFSSYAQGDTIASVDGITFNPLNFARIDNCHKSKTGFADLRFELGWDFLQGECYHLGIDVQGAAPTGTRPSAVRLFSPVIGNGKHWELGGGLTGHYIFWMNEFEDKSFGFYFDINVTHLFKARQQRTFDLCGKPNSRYILAEKLTPPVSNLQGTPTFLTSPFVEPLAGTVPSAQFKNEFSPVANLTTTDVNVRIGAQADIVALFNYSSCGFSWDVGYNFWGRSCEKITFPSKCTTPTCPTATPLCSPAQQNVWALKGDARVFGFPQGSTMTPDPNAFIALSATESGATIHGGTNAAVTDPLAVGADPFYKANFGVDNPQFANDSILPLAISPNLMVINGVGLIKTSVNPVFINCIDIDRSGTRGISHKIFTHFSYDFDYDCYNPFIGVGGFAEFGKRNRSNCDDTGCINTACNPLKKHCENCALSQWGVWIKGGISFN